MITMQQFIQDNRPEIDQLIHLAWPDWNHYEFDDDQREDWILNHEPLYMLAQQAGVDV